MILYTISYVLHTISFVRVGKTTYDIVYDIIKTYYANRTYDIAHDIEHYIVSQTYDIVYNIIKTYDVVGLGLFLPIATYDIVYDIVGQRTISYMILYS